MTLQTVLLFLNLAALVTSLALFALILRKVSRIDRKVWRLSDELPGKIRELFRQTEALDAVYRELHLSHPLSSTREWAASPDALRALTEHALRAKPRTIVECGSGVSTVVLARCAQMNGTGHIHSLDHEAEFAQRTRIELERHGLKDWATVLHAPLEPHVLRGESWPWYRLDDSLPSKIDLLFIDGPPTMTRDVARYPAGPLLLRRLTAGGVAFLDDAGRPDEKRAVQMWREEFPDLEMVSLDCEKGLARLSRK